MLNTEFALNQYRCAQTGGRRLPATTKGAAARAQTGLLGIMGDLLLDDVFEITAVDPDGKKFDRVSRIQAKSDNFDMRLLLDVNVEIYPLQTTQKFTLALAKSLSLDPTNNPLDADVAWRPDAGPSLADKYEYVMFGRVFKFEDVSSSRMFEMSLSSSFNT